MSADQSNEDKFDKSLLVEPPTNITGILYRLGPGLIVAGSIVGSGELIATTKTGAEAGFWLLWLILVGCVIKVFVQVEFGRYTITSGRTTMSGMNEVPGPRFGSANWLVWFWFIMFLASLAQLGGIVGGVGQALSISVPLTHHGRMYKDYADDKTTLKVKRAQLALTEKRGGEADVVARLNNEINERMQRIEQVRTELNLMGDPDLIASAAEQKRLNSSSDTGLSPAIAKTLVAPQAAVRAKLAEVKKRVSKLDRSRSHRKRVMKQIDGADTTIIELEEQLQATDIDVKKIGLLQGLAHSQIVAAQESLRDPDPPLDPKLWAALLTAMTAAILVIGRYNFIQSFSTFMVASFTLLTVINVCLLQSHADWSVQWQDIVNGMSFRVPPAADEESKRGIATALATFGIIGVGAAELITYPYWCLEKGYARYTGPNDPSTGWANRAKGWMRVLRWDAWCSMIIYTFATVAFYLLGAATLGRIGMNPGGHDMIRTLGVMYEPVFGALAQVLFLFGAFAVLYSTFFVANASHARVFPDALRVLGVTKDSDATYKQCVKIFSAVFPFVCLTFFVFIEAPAKLVLFSGLMQAIMLPMLAGAALFFRYKRGDSRILPGRAWDTFLWLSAIGMLISGSWALVDKLLN